MLDHAEPQISYPKIVKVEGNNKKWSWLFFPMSRRIPYNLMHEANFKKNFQERHNARQTSLSHWFFNIQESRNCK